MALPVTSTLLAPLNDLQALSQKVFLSLSPIQSRPPPPSPLSDFLTADANLAIALDHAQSHQIRQRRIEALKTELLALDAQWRAICVHLKQGQSELGNMIEESEGRLKAIDGAKHASIPYPELLAYAQSLSAFTSAPPNMPDLTIPGQPPTPLFFPPFPNEEKMRRGRLNAEEPLGLLGETHSVGRPPTPSPKIMAAPQDHASTFNPYRQDSRSQQPFFDLDLDLNPDL